MVVFSNFGGPKSFIVQGRYSKLCPRFLGMLHRAQTVYLISLLHSQFLCGRTSQWRHQFARPFLFFSFIVEIRNNILLWGPFQQLALISDSSAVFKSDHVSAVHQFFVVRRFGSHLQIVGDLVEIPQILLAQYGRSWPKIGSRILLAKWDIVFWLHSSLPFVLRVDYLAGSPLGHLCLNLTPLFEQLLPFEVLDCRLSQMVVELMQLIILWP